MKNENLALYKLSTIKGFGSKTLNIIVDRFKQTQNNLSDLFDVTEKEFNELFPEFGKGRFKGVTHEALHEINHALAEKLYLALGDEGIKVVTILDENYPQNVRKALVDNTPPILYFKGDLSLLSAPSISIAGSRKVDNQTLAIAQNFAEELVEGGYDIVSGYAKGIDSRAHNGALERGGSAIAVLSSGMKEFIRKEKLGKEDGLERNVLFISQFLPEESWQSRNAMIRNKLVCALSEAILIISSGEERDPRGKMSGTFDAAKSALKMGMPLFVVSGSLFNTKPAGNEILIKMGGVEVRDAKDIIDNLGKKQTQKNEQLKLI